MLTKTQILDALRQWIKQRPGLEFGNYGDVSAYRAEMRAITKDRHHAETLLRQVELRDSITAADLLKAFRAYSGRLSISETQDGKARLDYCTGQYFPTEYRRAACAVLASALWDWARDKCMPEPVRMHNSETGENVDRYNGLRAGDWLRQNFRREFGRSIANRWFN